MVKLSPRQQLFADEYLVDLNGKQAAIRAGYSPKTAEVQASRLLTVVKVRTYIDKKMAERSRRTGVNADRVVIELARIAFANPTNIVDTDTAEVDNNNDDDTAAIQSIKVKRSFSKDGESVEREIRFNDKTRSLELLGKHLGMFTDNVNVTGSVEQKQVLDVSKLTDKQLRELLHEASEVDEE